MLPIDVNICDPDDHVHEVERSIRTVKERTRCTIQGLPFRKVPKILIRAAVEGAHRGLNQFPTENGASREMSPLTIVTGQPAPDYNDLKLEFGTYVQIFEENRPTNTTKRRTTGAIALNPNGNSQGGYHFLSLATGARVARQQWRDLPMPVDVIQHVEDMAEDEGQLPLGNEGPRFEWNPGIPIEGDPERNNGVDEPNENEWGNGDGENDDDEAEDDDTENDEYIEYDGSDTEAEDAIDDGDIIAGRGYESEDPDESEIDDATEDGSGPEDSENEDSEDENSEEMQGANEDEHGTISDVDDEEATEDENMAGDDNTQERYNLRGNRERSYGHRFDRTMDEPENTQSYGAQYLQTSAETFASENTSNEQRMRIIVGYLMTQMTAKAGIRKHGKVAIEALFQEFLQLHNQKVFEGKFAYRLTRAQKRQALRAISVIKEKRCGKIKGRTVADGRPQRTLYEKHETASPTVSNEALMLTLLIDALEERDVGIADVTGAYLNATMDDFTLLKLEGASVRIMCNVSKEYEKFVTKERGKEVLYLQLKKALYGCVKSALLWYELFAGTLQEMGFKINPYDNCVANKDINGSQCTIVWYVDDTKISHKDPQVVSEVIETIEKHFGKMSVNRGKEHTFLGMGIKLNKNGTVTIDMSDYVKEAISESGEEIKKAATSPGKRDLFEIDDKSPRLPKKKAELFHSIVAKLLYVSKKSRLDVQLAVSFLCTRVSCCTEDDWSKLVRVLEYLYGTKDDVRKIGADDLKAMATWVDAAFGVHRDLKSHTGGMISFGTGAVLSKASKQKLNTKSSTEAELVGASDYLPYAIWVMKFLKEQGYNVEESKFYQDNESAIRFEKNGRRSCGPNSRHIDIRYFFVKDRLESEGFEVEHCPTERMIADFFTKPLQGGLFRKLREVIMGRKHVKWLLEQAPTAPKERVEKGKKKNVCTPGAEARKAKQRPLVGERGEETSANATTKANRKEKLTITK